MSEAVEHNHWGRPTIKLRVGSQESSAHKVDERCGVWHAARVEESLHCVRELRREILGVDDDLVV